MAQERELPPYVRFSTEAIEDRTQIMETGYGFRDVDMVYVTRPGSRDTFVAKAEKWLDSVAVKVRNGEMPREWLQQFRDIYDQYKKGQETPVDGIPIKGWSAISPAMQLNLLMHNIRTVEELAALDASGQERVGMGAVTLVQRAQAWLESAHNTGTAAAKMEALTVENTELRRQLADLSQKVQQLSEAHASGGIAVKKAA